METFTVKVLQVKPLGHGFTTYLRVVDIPIDEMKEAKGNVGSVLELVFKWGQNDFQPKKSPSVSMGDIAIYNGKFYSCELVGWKEIPPILA